MEKKPGGILDQLGIGLSPNLDEVQREAADPKGEDVAFADVLANPSKYRLSVGKECALVLVSVSPEPINLIAGLLGRAGQGGLLVVETMGEEACLSSPSSKDFALALSRLIPEIPEISLKAEPGRIQPRKGGTHYAAIKRITGRLKVKAGARS